MNKYKAVFSNGNKNYSEVTVAQNYNHACKKLSQDPTLGKRIQRAFDTFEPLKFEFELLKVE